MEARAPAPSKRHVDARAPEPAPSKRYVNARAPEPAPSKRHVDARAPLPAPSKRAPNPAPSKRSEVNQKRTVDQSIMVPSKVHNFGIEYCPKDHSACPVFSQPGNMPRTAAEWEDVSYECVDFEADLRSCGGCSSLDPMLHDCSLIPGAQGVSCVAGQCLVSSCRPGYTLRGDNQACFPSA
ncbi:hypothetical protein BV22DRAFT_1014427 [Leucogyrophana mollusca]|uniref:Uncharacterized protein n=1 Tax=Leucogyrophana mollusca TaxID=85980 RepID=A0ACB8BF70_9AGAM|nr:hypothetical protein BV22DRAFT_1014427 [Leucogyrophana mollusca]